MLTSVTLEISLWSHETGTPPMIPPEEIAWRERCGAVVDLRTGVAFWPSVNWCDFARRWVEFRRHAGRPLAVDALAAAIQRADDGYLATHGRPGIYAQIAHATLADLLVACRHPAREPFACIRE